MADQKAAPSVEYNWLSPNSGIKVSNICLGTMTFGQPNPLMSIPGNTDGAASHAILDRYHELGGNFLDTANVYNFGESEQIIGSWLAKHDRSKIVVATKVRFSGDFIENPALPNEFGLSRGSIMHNVDQSLKRLKTDYIDLYYMHGWDSGVKIEETLRAFNDLVRIGKIRYFGASNLTGSQLQKLVAYGKFMGFEQCIALQQEYNLLEHHSDYEVIPTCKSEGVSVIPYSPLKGGLLTGKFKRDNSNPADSLAGTRLGWTAEKPGERTMGPAPSVEDWRNNEDYWSLMTAMETIGKKHGKNQTQVALRWVLQKDFVPSIIIGAKTIKQLEDNMGAGTGWKLTSEDMKQLDDLSAFAGAQPIYPYAIGFSSINLNRTRP